MRIKRVLQETALTALAAAAWMGAGTVDASAAEFSIDNVTGISTSGAINIKTEGTGYKEIMFGVASYNKSKSTVKMADNAWDVYEIKDNSPLSIDLSKLSLTKDNYIAIKSESTEPIYIRIGASVTSQKVQYKAGKLTIDFKKKGDNASSLAPATAPLEYRTTYSSWNDFTYNADAEIFTEYQSQGATLYVRAKATVPSSFTKEPNKIKDAAGNEYTLYTGALMPGKESKVNIKKLANGPSVTADYKNGEVKIPNKAEYRVIANGSTISDIKSETGSKKIRDLLNLSSTTATSGTIEVRKQGDSNKSPSKWTRVDIEIPAQIAVNEGIDANHVITATGASTEGKVANGITITPQQTTKKEYAKKITVKVDTGVGDINVQVGTNKAVLVKDGQEKKNIKADAKAEIKIAKAGDKKKKIWASEYIPVGKAQ